jgi:hypothetical protein
MDILEVEHIGALHISGHIMRYILWITVYFGLIHISARRLSFITTTAIGGATLVAVRLKYDPGINIERYIIQVIDNS